MTTARQKIASLKKYQKWRRGDEITKQPDTTELGMVLDWAIAVCDAAENLVRVQGRFHSEIAYKRLESAVNGTGGGA